MRTFQKIANEYYSRDISNKVRSAVRSKKAQGKYLSNFAPIGYQKDSKDNHKLIIEETGAAIVKRVFKMARSNISGLVISRIFTKEGVITPRNLSKWLLHGTDPTPKRLNPETVSAILRNRTYLGETVQGTTDCTRFRRVPAKHRPQEEWIITPGTHEPLVDIETFELVSKLVSERHRPKRTDEIQLLQEQHGDNNEAKARKLKSDLKKHIARNDDQYAQKNQ